MIPGFPPPMSFPRSKSVALFLAAAVALSSCAIGGPKHSMEELRAIYGQWGNLQAMVLASGNLEHVESLAKLSNDFDRGGMLLDAVELGSYDLAKQLVELLLRYVDNPDNVVRRYGNFTALNLGNL